MGERVREWKEGRLRKMEGERFRGREISLLSSFVIISKKEIELETKRQRNIVHFVYHSYHIVIIIIVIHCIIFTFHLSFFLSHWSVPVSPSVPVLTVLHF